MGVLDRLLGLGAHAALDRIVESVFQARRVDDGEVHVGDAAGCLAAVAGDAGHVMDDRQSAADQTVEKGGLADIGATDDGDPECRIRLTHV